MFNLFNVFRDLRVDTARVAIIAVVPHCVVRTMAEYQEHAGLEAFDFFERRLVEITFKGEKLGWFDVQITERSNGKVSVVNGYLTESERRKLAELQITVKCEVVEGYFDLNHNFKRQYLGKSQRPQYRNLGVKVSA